MLSIKNIETWYDLIRALHGIPLKSKRALLWRFWAATVRAKQQL